jgi:hypothetical protein
MDVTSPPHSPGIYQPLAPRLTRIFEIEPGNFSDPIVGRLVSQEIDAEPYEAVSYVWGDTRKRRDITIDGETLSITENLHGALTAFRLRPNDTSSTGNPGLATQQVRRLWADAVCINQEDLPERTSQVELMGRIFASAYQVLAWLGWEEGEVGRRHTQTAIEFIHAFMDDPEAHLEDARVLLHYDAADPITRPSYTSDYDRYRFEELVRNWDAIKEFFDIEYFHRTWIVQELGLARRALMYTALKPVQGATIQNKALEMDYIEWALVGQFVKFMDYNGASLVTHLNLLLWVAHHILMIWEKKEDGTPACDFLTAMHWARILRVSDPRDRAFSLLGHPLAVMDGNLVIKPDYTITRGKVYTILAANFIQKTKNLYVVNLVDHEDDPSTELREWDPEDESRMPSWVPDWHSINRTTPMPYAVAASEIEDSKIQIIGHEVRMERSYMPHLIVSGWVVDEVAVVCPRMETTDFPVTHLTRERTKKNPFWLDRVWEMVSPADGSAGQDALAVLDSLSLALPLGTREKDQPMSTVGPQQSLEEHRRSFAAYVLEYHELRRSVPDLPGTDYRGTYLPTRSLLDSLPGDAQVELRRRAEGSSAGRFVECMTWPSMCRVVYKTATGLIGMGSRVTRLGDLVCRIRGSPVLMTLRRIENAYAMQKHDQRVEVDAASITCAHVGPTVMPARMKPGITDGEKFGEEASRFIII